MYTLTDAQISEIEDHLVAIQSIILQVKGHQQTGNSPLCVCGKSAEPHRHCAGCDAVINPQYDPESELCCECYAKDTKRMQFIENMEVKRL